MGGSLAWRAPAFADAGGTSAKLTLSDAQEHFRTLNGERMEHHVT
jgi:hypothetical protein